ncbi:MAG: MraY family glycosyltransferase [Breznakia sp.]
MELEQGTISYLLYFIIPLMLSLVLTPLVNWIGLKLDICAQQNERTIHTRRTTNIGGVAIYVAFILSMTYFIKGVDAGFEGLLIGSFIMFMAGLIDDIVDMKPMVKLGFEVIAAFTLIYIGKIELGTIHLPFAITIDMGVVSFLVTFVWIIGITNAINLIDGLDGLAGGVSIIVLLTIAVIAIVKEGRADIAMISLVGAGATGGFLFFNIHPAKIFMGDSGALFLGFLIAAISLMGFKGSTFITLGFPILLLCVPIVDTLSAILRRFLGGKKFSDADRGHFHHVLMRRFGHRNTVWIIYVITLVFGMSAYVYIENKSIGLFLVLGLLLALEIFIEQTQMISKGFHPITTLFKFIFKKKDDI